MEPNRIEKDSSYHPRMLFDLNKLHTHLQSLHLDYDPIYAYRRYLKEVK
jgi:hypothetical protein